MSTPTTAVATLPRYHSSHYHHPPAPYPPQHQHLHLQNHSPHLPQHHHTAAANNNLVGPSYLPLATASVLPPPSKASSTPSSTYSTATGRLLTFYNQSAASGAALPAVDGVAQPSIAQSQSSAPPRPPPHTQAHHRSQASGHGLCQQKRSPSPPHIDSYLSTMSSATMVEHSSRKRQCSYEPDWNKFYCNGLPQEIIVIEDTPEPEANTCRKVTNGISAAHQPAKRRRADAGYHVQYVGHGVQSAGHDPKTPLKNLTPVDSTLSSDGTHSLHTAAPTSLSSNSQYDEVQIPLKRKRTRLQVANEAKRRDIDGLGDPFLTYKPPPHPPKKASDVHVRVVHDRYHDKNFKVDDEDGHYIVVPDADLTEKYQINCLLGQGTFGKVVQARDRRRNKLVAVKIIRSVQKYRDASRIELRVLATLKANDEENRNRCIHLRDCFDYRGHICIVMDLLGQSVFDFLKGNGFVPFPNSQIQSFARQLFTSVAFLHDLNLIHTDLKPENILLYDNTYQTFTYNRKIPSSSTTINRQSTQRRVLLDTEIRLIDFGSATFQDEYHSSVVSTRHYRAPEIILGLGWSYPCDIWSIGCILVEFFTGDALFQTHDNLEHLAMMEAVVGRRIDCHLVQAVNKMATRSGGNLTPKRYFKRLKLDYPTPETTRGSRRFVKAMKHLHEIIPSNTAFFKNFLDLLTKIFVYDPAQRITAKEALAHPWFKEIAVPDDGTEAVKIRLEKQRAEREFSRIPNYVT